jgi:Glycosyl transferase family 2
MRLGGFVIHGDNAGTIRPCLDSLAAVCDELVSVDTGSGDGSSDLAAARGFKVERRPWEGYGAARAVAAEALRGCDWVLFLDSDEWFDPPALEAIRRFKLEPPDAPYVTLRRRDWADIGGQRFLYRREHHIRLVRIDHARWDRSMIIHEALPRGPTVDGEAVIEHLFATDVEAMRSKVERYALLWALRHHESGHAGKWPPLQRVAHLFRELILKGVLFRCPAEGLGLAHAIADYHVRKYELLREVAEGRHESLLALLRDGRLEELFRVLHDETGPSRPAAGVRRAVAPSELLTAVAPREAWPAASATAPTHRRSAAPLQRF